MRAARHLLAGTAMAATLAIGAAQASPFNSSFENRVPMPTPANVAPPSVQELSPTRASVTTPAPSAAPAPTVTVIQAPTQRLRVSTTTNELGDAPPVRVEGLRPSVTPSSPSPRASETRAPAPSVVATPSPARAAQASAVSGLDVPMADKLRDLIANKPRFDRLVRAADRDAVAAFYEKNKFAPLWTDNGNTTTRADAAVAHLQTVDGDALDPDEYAAPQLTGSNPDALAEAEVRFTAIVLTYARHAMDGRVHWSRVAPDIFYPESFNPADVLNRLSSSTDLARTMAAFNPPHAGYRALRAKYNELRRQSSDDADTRIPSGPVLRISKDKQGRDQMPNDARVPHLRERLSVPAESNTTYNKTLAAAVAKFQTARNMKPTGHLDAATVAALNPANRTEQLDTIRANLERWRWLPRDFGRIHVSLNIPDYNLRVMNNGQQVWTTRVVVGKPTQATPLISDTMKYITVNPIWHPPQSIIYQELMPAYEAGDRNIFERQGLKVERRQNGEIRVFQPPGERNALGRLRFNFPNKFLVYMHDTPEKSFFSRDRRALSHGCMRVQDPLKYAEVLLSLGAPKSNYTQEGIRRMYGDQEKQLDLQIPIQVHLSYQTALVDDSGKLSFREDIYGLDKKLLTHLKGEERRVADVVMERPADPNFQPKPQDRQRLNNLARNGGGPNPFALFEQLFR